MSCKPLVSCPPECVFSDIPLDQAVRQTEKQIDKYCGGPYNNVFSCQNALQARRDLILNYSMSGLASKEIPVTYEHYEYPISNLSDNLLLTGYGTMIGGIAVNGYAVTRQNADQYRSLGVAGIIVMAIGFFVAATGAAATNALDKDALYATMIANSDTGLFPISDTVLGGWSKEGSAKKLANDFCDNEYGLVASPFKVMTPEMADNIKFRVYTTFECVEPGIEA